MSAANLWRRKRVKHTALTGSDYVSWFLSSGQHVVTSGINWLNGKKMRSATVKLERTRSPRLFFCTSARPAAFALCTGGAPFVCRALFCRLVLRALRNMVSSRRRRDVVK